MFHAKTINDIIKSNFSVFKKTNIYILKKNLNPAISRQFDFTPNFLLILESNTTIPVI
jgi:hypothetical protein